MEITLKPYLAGQFIETSKKLDIRSPYNNELIASTFLCEKEEIEIAIQKGIEAKKILKNYPSWKKYEALLYISQEIIKNKENLSLILSKESAKPYKYAKAEIERAAQTFLIAAEESKRISGTVIRLDWTPHGNNKNGIIQYFPVGLIAGISPFNFPMNLAVHKIAPAIASGCPIILKPATSTPLSTLSLAKIIHETDLPHGAVSILPADRTSGNLLVTDDRINLLSFTGSDTVGWQMKASAGKKKTVLELGGNAGVIISESADVDLILETCLTGAFSYSGQICIHAQRFFVHKNHYQKFIEKLSNGATKLKTGIPENPDTEFSCMIDESNAIRVENWINEAIGQGAELISGGKRLNTLVSPTILINTTPEMKVNSEEIFGPVITVEPFDEFENAVNMLNDSRFGLQAGVFTNNLTESDYAFREIEAGGIIINNVPTLRFDHMPYGGVKDSGIGREGVYYAMLDMLETKILVK